MSIDSSTTADIELELNSDDNMRIPEFSLDNDKPGKYAFTITNILSKHTNEIRNNIDNITTPLYTTSRRKLKEMVTKHNNEIFGFMRKPNKTPNILGLAEAIFRRYGQDIPNLKSANSQQISNDLNLDSTIDGAISDLSTGLKKLQTENGGLDDFFAQTKWIINKYKTIGEEVLRLEALLLTKIDLLDKLNSRLPLITGLANNDALGELIEAFNKYAEMVFKSCDFEKVYKELIEAYKKWNICREVIMLNRIITSDTSEPQCSICLNDPISYAFVPCGHTFCNMCVKKQNLACYICRSPIRERLKLFIG